MLHHESPDQKVWGLVVAVQDSNRAAAHSAVSKATVRLCLARGSQRLGMSTRKEQRQGITMEVVPCLLLCIPLYCAFQVNRCVRPYMVGTHVRRKKGRF